MDENHRWAGACAFEIDPRVVCRCKSRFEVSTCPHLDPPERQDSPGRYSRRMPSARCARLEVALANTRANPRTHKYFAAWRIGEIRVPATLSSLHALQACALNRD